MSDVDAAACTVSATVEVALPPAEASRVFTAEIGSWYVVDEHTVADHRRTVDIRVEPFVGGRLVDVYDPVTGQGREMGRISVWDPPHRLTFTDARDTPAGPAALEADAVDHAVAEEPVQRRAAGRVRAVAHEQPGELGRMLSVAVSSVTVSSVVTGAKLPNSQYGREGSEGGTGRVVPVRVASPVASPPSPLHPAANPARRPRHRRQRRPAPARSRGGPMS